jgi:hypothetical protein
MGHIGHIGLWMGRAGSWAHMGESIMGHMWVIEAILVKLQTVGIVTVGNMTLPPLRLLIS